MVLRRLFVRVESSPISRLMTGALVFAGSGAVDFAASLEVSLVPVISLALVDAVTSVVCWTPVASCSLSHVLLFLFALSLGLSIS